MDKAQNCSCCMYKPESSLEQCSSCELEDILEASYDGLFITDGKGKVLMVNSAWERICGIHRDSVVGQVRSGSGPERDVFRVMRLPCASRAKKDYDHAQDDRRG